MSDNQNRSNMAEFIAGLSFASAAASNALSAANSPFSVASTITIRNRTKWTLKLHNVYLHAGFVKKPVAAIDPGYMEIMETHNTGHTACGKSSSRLPSLRALSCFPAPFRPHYERWILSLECYVEPFFSRYVLRQQMFQNIFSQKTHRFGMVIRMRGAIFFDEYHI